MAALRQLLSARALIRSGATALGRRVALTERLHRRRPHARVTVLHRRQQECHGGLADVAQHLDATLLYLRAFVLERSDQGDDGGARADAGQGFDGGETDRLVAVHEHFRQGGDSRFGVGADAAEGLDRHAAILVSLSFKPLRRNCTAGSPILPSDLIAARRTYSFSSLSASPSAGTALAGASPGGKRLGGIQTKLMVSILEGLHEQRHRDPGLRSDLSHAFRRQLPDHTLRLSEIRVVLGLVPTVTGGVRVSCRASSRAGIPGWEAGPMRPTRTRRRSTSP